MRIIKFNELNLKNINDVNVFYQYYLKTLQSEVETDSSFHLPTKQYEIFSLDELDGKLFLLNKNYIKNEDTTNQELFYDYSIAFEIYNLFLDIYDGIEDEKNEFNELYLNERLEKNNQIEILKAEDESLYLKALEEYDIITNSQIYNDYLNLLKENKSLRKELSQLKENSSNNFKLKTTNNSLLEKIINKIKSHLFS